MNCPFCHRYFAKKDQAIEHINKFHAAQLEKDGMDAAQERYYATHKTLHGKCQCGCGRDTEWNYKTGKPYKVSTNPECRKRLRAQALVNHRKVYGVDTLLNDMEHQKEMQHNRPTAGQYQFPDGGKVPYLSKLEEGFLRFCDQMMEFSSNMIQESPEIFTYTDPKDKKRHQYIPDYYLPDYNLLVEIKDGGEHPNTNPAFIKETKYKVALKDDVMRKQKKYNYIKIVDGKYGPFMELLYQITHKDIKTYQQPAGNFIVITEAAMTDPDEAVDLTQTVDYRDSKYYPYFIDVPDSCNERHHHYGINIGSVYYMDDENRDEILSLKLHDLELHYGEYAYVYELIDDALWDEYNLALNEYMEHNTPGLRLIEILAAHGLFVNYPGKVSFRKVKMMSTDD